MTWRLLILLSFPWAIVANLGGTAQGQQLVVRPVEVPTQVTPGQQTGWMKIAPQRQVNDARLGKVLSDIESHMPAGHIYRDADLVTWAHETTHGINSNVRMATGAGTNAFYCLNDWVGVYREPRLRKSDVCRYVPANMRGDVWSLYMAGQADWDDKPLYILDEWVAYINGAISGQELAKTGQTGNRSLAADVGHAYEMAGYASALMVAIDKHDPNYSDKAKLAEFVAFNVKRTQALNPSKQVAQCEGGNCNQGGWQPSVGSSVPGPEPYTPPQPVNDPRVDQLVEAHEEWVQNQRQWIKVVQNIQATGGAKGDKGDRGDKGEAGAAGKCDETQVNALLVQINQLKIRLAELEKPRADSFTVKLFDNGKLIPNGTREVKLGGTLPLERYPIGQ